MGKLASTVAENGASGASPAQAPAIATMPVGQCASDSPYAHAPPLKAHICAIGPFVLTMFAAVNPPTGPVAPRAPTSPCDPCGPGNPRRPRGSGAFRSILLMLWLITCLLPTLLGGSNFVVAAYDVPPSANSSATYATR